jgi:hypothetical protein
MNINLSKTGKKNGWMPVSAMVCGYMGMLLTAIKFLLKIKNTLFAVFNSKIIFLHP